MKFLEFLTGDTRKIFVSNTVDKTVDESNSAFVLVGCKPIMEFELKHYQIIIILKGKTEYFDYVINDQNPCIAVRSVKFWKIYMNF